MSPAPRRSRLETAVRKAIREAPTAPSWKAELALTLVAEIQSAGEDAPLAARVSAAKVLRETMTEIAAAAPKADAKDRLDDLAARRAKRTARTASA